MTTLQMEIALMSWLDIREHIVVPNVSWGLCHDLHECDIISLTHSGYATEVEIKISKEDLLADKAKAHDHKHKLIKYLYYAVPDEMKNFALENIPENTGLLVVRDYTPGKSHRYLKHHVRVVKNPGINNNVVKWSPKRTNKLARLGTMRILGLKHKLEKKENKRNERSI